MFVEAPVEKSGRLNIWKDEVSGSDSDYGPSQIDKREGLSRKEFLHEYVLKNRPVVLKDGAKGWPALSKWTPEFFREHYGSKESGCL